jgi:hypothetical protein
MAIPNQASAASTLPVFPSNVNAPRAARLTRGKIKNTTGYMAINEVYNGTFWYLRWIPGNTAMGSRAPRIAPAARTYPICAGYKPQVSSPTGVQ